MINIRTSSRIAAIAFVVSSMLTVIAAPAIAQSQIYKYTDKDGNVIFSDKKPPESNEEQVEEVQLNATNSAPPPPDLPKVKKPVKSDAEDEGIVYESVITNPSDGSTIPMGPGNFAVTAAFSPGLRSGERVQLIMDGTPVGGPQRGSAWQLSNVNRGEHKLIVRRLARGGEVADSSVPVTVYVLRPSIR